MRPYHTTRSRFQRPAFTLIELIVVVTIIAILVSLSAAAVVRFITAQEINNTRTTINKVYSSLTTSYKASRQQFFTEPIPEAAHNWILNTLANPADPNAENRIRVIWMKMRYKQMFPMTFSEALDPWPWAANQGAPTYRAYLGKLGIKGSTGAACESSACLLMALTQAQGGGGVNAEDLAGGQSVASFTLPTGQTVQAFVDAWGNPLTFARWPTGTPPTAYSFLNPNGWQPGYNDPLDPNGYLSLQNTNVSVPWGKWLSTYGSTYSQYLHALAPTGTYSFYLIPMIVSNGPDKKLGLDPTTLAILSHDADDDIYSTTAP